MLKVEITSDQTRQFKTTLALLIQEELDKLGIRSEVVVDTPHINFLDNVDGLAAFSEKNPVLIKEVR
ncbi:hypothetical protein LCGC14_1598150 [marine sediment metagenome]|uniref:Uncharacterized protein n=1 Tax=marine sediment metagenome TaxID=412755 RepID=A0A0F9IBY8_9ZZZZ